MSQIARKEVIEIKRDFFMRINMREKKNA